MTDPAPPPPPSPADVSPALARRAHLAIVALLQAVMAAELILLIVLGRWLQALLVASVMVLILVPLVVRRLPVEVPPEVQIAIILFVFATLFLGEVRDYYERYWWWDVVLHTGSGILLGAFGFMLVYIMNENSTVDLRMRPSFVALFAFFFAVAMGAIWEIFEFAMDRAFGLQMQKPMAGDPSGLTDTMWDLIVDTIGAAVVSLAGWRYLKRARRTYVDDWARRFLARNPQLFGK